MTKMEQVYDSMALELKNFGIHPSRSPRARESKPRKWTNIFLLLLLTIAFTSSKARLLRSPYRPRRFPSLTPRSSMYPPFQPGQLTSEPAANPPREASAATITWVIRPVVLDLGGGGSGRLDGLGGMRRRGCKRWNGRRGGLLSRRDRSGLGREERRRGGALNMECGYGCWERGRLRGGR